MIDKDKLEEAVQESALLAPPQPVEQPGGEPASPAQDETPEPAPQPPEDILPPVAETPVSSEPTEPVWEFEDGTRLTRSEAARLAGLQSLLVSDASLLNDFQELVNRHIQGAPAPLPEGFDPDDPTAQVLLPQLQAVQAELARTQAQIAQLSQAQEVQSESQFTSLINRAKHSFAQQQGISASDAERVFQVAQQVVNIPALVQAAQNPLDGMTQKPDPLAAIEAAMTLAYRGIPEFYQREVDKMIAQREADAQRQQKLNALGGGGGGAPQTPELPKDPRQAALAMARDLMSDNLSQQP
jgi:hypothetical protein